MAITAEHREDATAGADNVPAVCLSGGLGMDEAAWLAVRPPLVRADVTDEPPQDAIELDQAIVVAHGTRRPLELELAADQANDQTTDGGQDRHSHPLSDQSAGLTIQETR